MIENLTPEIAEEAEVLVPAASESAENVLTDRIIGAAIEVHRHLGPGFLESVYEQCLCYELTQLGLRFQTQVHLPIHYKGLKLEGALKMDMVVEEAIVVEIKATEGLSPIHSAQLLTYLKSANKRVGLLINFNVPILKNGLKRIVNHYAGPPIKANTSAPSALDSLSSPRLRVSASKEVPASNRRPR